MDDYDFGSVWFVKESKTLWPLNPRYEYKEPAKHSWLFKGLFQFLVNKKVLVSQPDHIINHVRAPLKTDRFDKMILECIKHFDEQNIREHVILIGGDDFTEVMHTGIMRDHFWMMSNIRTPSFDGIPFLVVPYMRGIAVVPKGAIRDSLQEGQPRRGTRGVHRTWL